MTMTTPPLHQDVTNAPDLSRWRQIVARYQAPSVRRSVLQLCTTLVPMLATFVAMYFTYHVSYLLTLGLAVIAAGFLIRTFIIMHDCGHGAFFKSRRANDIVGFITGVLTLTPYVQWRRDHAIHHAHSGHLDERGYGDVTTLTVNEYLQLNWWGRLKYRVYRNPVIMLVVGPIWLMVVKHRFHTRDTAGKREIIGVHATNLTLLLLFVATSLLIGPVKVLALYLPAMFLAGAFGIWLFYVQHQFEDTYWARPPQWDYVTAAVAGSSYFRLPKVLDWFTGYIGYHHVHHLSPKIPFYNLRKCHEENPVFQMARQITLGESFRTFRLKLWDEERGHLIGWRELRARVGQ
jgi:omega-6 fatty acid desaturase (delta-12 desaturase)